MLTAKQNSQTVRTAKRVVKVGVTMPRSVTIRWFSFTILFLAAFALATTQPAWSENQSTQPPTPAAKLNPPANAATGAGVETAPAGRPPIVPAIGDGDLLKISVLGAPESEQEVRVDGQGNAFLNFVGSVQVAGLTTEQAQVTIGKKLAEGGFFTQPQVSVFVKEYATQGVSVMGEVNRPGIYPLLGARTLFDVLSLAGGTTPKAGQVVHVTHRARPQEPISVALSNTAGSDAVQSAHNNVDIYPGDIVVVSKAGIVYVVGDVRRPSGVIMENGTQMTVLQAIAMAEGTNPTASLNGAKLIRKTVKGPQETPLELKKILSAKSPDVTLQADDIIFVPSSAAKSATKRSMDAIIQIATGMAVYGHY
jgi:polysaccharide export outer membrane protein